MADLNALIAQGYQFQPLPDPFAQYGKMQQLENSATQNRLAQQQLAASQRAEAQANTINQAYSNAINSNTGEIDYASLRRAMASGGAGSQIPGIEKLRLEAENATLQKQKLQGEVNAQPVALAEAKSKAIESQIKTSKDTLDRINPNSPNARDQLMAWHQGNHTGYLGELLKSQGSTPEKTIADIDAAVALGPKGISDFIGRSVGGTREFEKKIAPIPKEVNNGKVKFLRDENQFSPTFMQEIPGSRTTLEMSPYETDHLQFLKDKEKFDRENPGFELREQTQSNGTTKTVKVSKKTGLASDVVYEGLEGKPVTGVSVPAQDLQFRINKENYERANPGITVQRITRQDGTEEIIGVDKNGYARPVILGTAPAPAIVSTPVAASVGNVDATTTLGAPPPPVLGGVSNAMVNNVNAMNTAGQPLISAAKPVAVTPSTEMKNAEAFALLKGPVGSPAYTQEFTKQLARLTAKSEGAAATPAAPVAVVGADGKVKYVSREEAISKGMTPASAMEGLAPKEIQNREAKYPVAKRATTTISATMTEIENTIDRLLANENGLNGITGFVGGRTYAVTDAARRAEADLKQLKNLAFVQGLTELRNASSTGAGVGNVSNKEGDRFENLKASLEQTQSLSDLKDSLKRLRSQSTSTRDTVNQAFEDTYAYRANAPAAAAAKPSGGGAPPLPPGFKRDN